MFCLCWAEHRYLVTKVSERSLNELIELWGNVWILPFAKFAIPHRLDVGIASLFKPINMTPLPLL